MQLSLIIVESRIVYVLFVETWINQKAKKYETRNFITEEVEFNTKKITKFLRENYPFEIKVMAG